MNHRVRVANLLLLFSASCVSVGPDYEPSPPEVPAEWANTEGSTYTGLPAAELGRWWRALNDSVLDSLIERALAANLDLRVALERVREARARRAQSTGQRFPDINGTGGYTRTRAGTNGFPALPTATSFDDWTLGLEASWEIDLWGSVRRQVEAANAELAVSVEDARHVQVVVAAEVARQYIDLRTFQARLVVAQENMSIQAQSLELARTRFRGGLAPALDVAQAETNLASTEAEIPSLNIGHRAAVLRLGVLLGELPTALLSELSIPAIQPEPPTVLGVGIPRELLRARPDVRASERALAAQIARIGVAEADYYPRFSLGGAIGWQSTSTANLIDPNSAFLGFGPAFRWNLFDGGRVAANVEIQMARAEQARSSYEATVLLALEEVENAMTAHAEQRVRAEALGRAVDSARRTVELARERYRAGQSDFQNVLDAERSLFAVEDGLLASKGQVLQSFIALQRALGGGWQPSPDEADRAAPRN